MKGVKLQEFLWNLRACLHLAASVYLSCFIFNLTWFLFIFMTWIKGTNDGEDLAVPPRILPPIYQSTYIYIYETRNSESQLEIVG